NFMKSSRPEQAAYNFIKDYQKLASATEFQKA
ncbi:MAG TPA: indole-3-glycerol-phosphate synthase TrpC, partial [Algoriphagus sp.]|nr:indole-3-glycerol-phosphate synthase TrpC [Algoriphagus sp.]